MKLFGLVPLALAPAALGCHEFMLMDSFPDTVISVRASDAAFDTMPTIVKIPRGHPLKSWAINGCDDCPLLEWKGKYGYIFVDWLHFGYASDGMNEKGLSVGSLLQTTDYSNSATTTNHTAEQPASVDPADPRQYIAHSYIAHYLLSQCETVDDVKEALNDFIVGGAGDFLKMLVEPSPTHFSVTDRAGNTAVLELTATPGETCQGNSTVRGGGKLCYYDNNEYRAVMHEPSFTEQQASIKASSERFGSDWEAYWNELPGDWRPLSRLARIVAMNRLSQEADGAWVRPSTKNPMPATYSAFTFIFDQLDVPAALKACVQATGNTAGSVAAYDAFTAELQNQINSVGVSGNATDIMEGVIADSGSTKEQFGNLAWDLSHTDETVARHVITFPTTFPNPDVALDAVNRAMFISSAAQLPPGSTAQAGMVGATECTLIRDHTNLNYYYTTPGNVGLQKIDLIYLDFMRSSEPLPLTVNQQGAYPDITQWVNNATLAMPKDDIEVAAPQCPTEPTGFSGSAIATAVVLAIIAVVGTGAGTFIGYKWGKKVVVSKLGYDSNTVY